MNGNDKTVGEKTAGDKTAGEKTVDEKMTGDKRLRIIAAAAAVFSRKGFHRAKIEEIAEEAEVGKGTVYEYFASKKELFLEMVYYVHQQYQEKLDHELAKAETFQDTLEKLFEVTLDFIRQHKDMALILLFEHAPVGEEFHHVLVRKEQQEINNVSRMLQDMVEPGGIRPVNAHAAALAVLGTLYLVCGQVIFHQSDQEPDFKQLSREAIDIILHGLVPRASEMV